MTYKEIRKKYEDIGNKIDCLHLEHRDLWLNESGTGFAKYNNKDLYLYCEDESVREKTFLSNVFRNVQKYNWHSDEIKTIDDAKEKLHVTVRESQMFPDYYVYFGSDFDKLQKLNIEMSRTMKTLWKTDIEFFRSCVEYIVNFIDFVDYYKFVYCFNDNVFGIKFSDVMKNPDMKQFIMEYVFEKLSKTTEPDEDECE